MKKINKIKHKEIPLEIQDIVGQRPQEKFDDFDFIDDEYSTDLRKTEFEFSLNYFKNKLINDKRSPYVRFRLSRVINFLEMLQLISKL